MSLLFQRQDLHNFEIRWAGRAGHYLNDDLCLNAQRWPTREADDDERSGRQAPRTIKTSDGHSKQVQREQRSARGLCRDCPNRLEDDLYTYCRPCRIKNSNAEAIINERRRLNNGGIRCTRCKRRRREYGSWCRLCANAAGVQVQQSA